MSQSIIFIFLFVALNAVAASPKKINELFAEFSKQKQALLTSDLTRQNIKEKVTTTYQELENKLAEVTKAEQEMPGDEMSPEGNTMAYELEFVETLKNFATGIMSQEECAKALQENELNNPIVEEDDGKAIAEIITKICKQ